MTTNIGTEDRVVRVVIAALAVISAVLVGVGSVAGIALLALAGVMTVTAVVGFCPLYRLLGISTRRLPRGARAAADR